MQPTSNARPAAITRAIGCLLAALALGAIASGISVGHEAYFGQALGGTMLATLVLLAVVAFYSALVYKIALGRNWARLTYVALFAIAVCEYVFFAASRPGVLSAALTYAPVQYGLCLAAACLQAYALWLVFKAPNSWWFKPLRVQF